MPAKLRSSRVPDALEPWKSFLEDLDASLRERAELHCLGGFVVACHFGCQRPTADIDILSAEFARLAELQRLAGEGSGLHSRHGVYLQPVRIVTYPEDYESRLERMWPKTEYAHIRLLALEAHDLALTKLERNIDKDREDIAALAANGPPPIPRILSCGAGAALSELEGKRRAGLASRVHAFEHEGKEDACDAPFLSPF